MSLMARQARIELKGKWNGSLAVQCIDYIDIKAKCYHLKNLPVKGLCGRCLSEFADWRYSQSCWYFRPSFVNCCSSSLLSGSGVLCLRQINPAGKSLYRSNFFNADILQCLLCVLSFYHSKYTSMR